MNTTELDSSLYELHGLTEDHHLRRDSYTHDLEAAIMSNRNTRGKNRHPISGQVDNMDEEVTLYTLHHAIVTLKNSIDTHKDEIDQKLQAQAKSIKKLGKTLSDKIEKETKELQEYIDGEMNRMIMRIDELEKKVEGFEKKQEEKDAFNEEQTVILSFLPQNDNEDLNQEVDTLIRQGLRLPHIPIVNTKRLNSTGNKPGIVKVQFKNLDDKKRVLNAKFNLAESQDYKKVHIRSSRSHADRLQEQNLKTLINFAFPANKDLYFTSNGRLMVSGFADGRDGGRDGVQDRGRGRDRGGDRGGGRDGGRSNGRGVGRGNGRGIGSGDDRGRGQRLQFDRTPQTFTWQPEGQTEHEYTARGGNPPNFPLQSPMLG